MPSAGAYTTRGDIRVLLLAAAAVVVQQQVALARAYNVSIKLYNKTPNSHHLVQQTFYEIDAAAPSSAVAAGERGGTITVGEGAGGGDFLRTRSRHGYDARAPMKIGEEAAFDYYEVHRDAGRVVSNVVQNIDEPAAPHGYKTTDGLNNPRWLCLALGICGYLGLTDGQNPKPPLMTLFEWKQLEFDYESERARQSDINSGFYQPNIAAPIDVDVYYRDSPKDNKVFVSIPRFQIGSPATLATISSKVYKGNPVLTPYPDWSWHRNPEQCRTNRLVSVYRVKIDECGKLWVLDTGRYGDQQTCPPQIIAFDLKTNTVKHRFEIPDSLLESRSILVTIVVDNRDKFCSHPIVYVADCQTYSIIVHDAKLGIAWKATDKTMYPFPDYGTFNIQGDQFDLMDGVLGMALEPYVPGRDRKLYYHAMSSGTENWVYTSHLRNETLFRDDPTSVPQVFNTYRTKRPSQACAMAMDRDGIAYFGLMSETSVNCWHSSNADYGKNIETVYRNPMTMQFPSGVKVINNLKGQQELWVLTSRFQKVATNSINTKETNFRINAGRVSDLLQRTRCKQGGFGSGHGSSYHGSHTGGYGLHSTPSHFN